MLSSTIGSTTWGVWQPSDALIADIYSEYKAHNQHTVTQRARDYWTILARENHSLFLKLGRKYGVPNVPTAAAEPYADADDLCRGINGGVLFVSTANDTHPLWTPLDNYCFRYIHDIGHWQTGAAFSLAGDVATYFWHSELLGQSVGAALFVEIVAQSVVWHVDGRPDIQKCYLPSFDVVARLEAERGDINAR